MRSTLDFNALVSFCDDVIDCEEPLVEESIEVLQLLVVNAIRQIKHSNSRIVCSQSYGIKSIRYFQYDKLATALLALLVCVILLEALSRILRKSAVHWSLGVIGLGAILGSWSLGISWLEILLK